MKTYLINSIKQVSVNSQSWDTISTLKSQEWIVYNEDISQVEKFLFIDDMKLLVSVNGKSSYSKWEYIKINSSLIIDDEINKYLLKIVVCNKDIIVLNVDSTNDYSFLINSKSSVLRNPTYEDIQWYLRRNCGVDILNEQQRKLFSEENHRRFELWIKIQQKQERDQKKLFKRLGIAAGIVLLLLIAILIANVILQSYIEDKKVHPTIHYTEEKNKVAVDLGLSVKWASCNVGANSPEEYGNYYGWGEISGQVVTKRNIPASVNDSQFPPRSKTDSLPSSITNGKFDMAKANWGGSWRLPTKDEAQELLDKCTISKVEKYNGIYCFKITGPNGNFIYIPLAGLREVDGEFDSRDEIRALATVWTGDISNICSYSYNDEHLRLAYALKISETDNGIYTGKIKCKLDHGVRWHGRPVRAVKD